MHSSYDTEAPKKSANLSINSDLLEKARKFNINLSSAFEKALSEIVKEKQKQEWLEENRDAIIEYNKRVEKHGAFSKEFRNF